MLLSKFSSPSLVMRRMASTAKGEHHGQAEMWGRIFKYICCPAIVVQAIHVYIKEVEHMKHYKQPEFKKYEYMYKRTRPFPWGDGNHTLFHNAKFNALPDGYEDPKLGVHWSH